MPAVPCKMGVTVARGGGFRRHRLCKMANNARSATWCVFWRPDNITMHLPNGTDTNERQHRADRILERRRRRALGGVSARARQGAVVDLRRRAGVCGGQGGRARAGHRLRHRHNDLCAGKVRGAERQRDRRGYLEANAGGRARARHRREFPRGGACRTILFHLHPRSRVLTLRRDVLRQSDRGVRQSAQGAAFARASRICLLARCEGESLGLRAARRRAAVVAAAGTRRWTRSRRDRSRLPTTRG